MYELQIQFFVTMLLAYIRICHLIPAGANSQAECRLEAIRQPRSQPWLPPDNLLKSWRFVSLSSQQSIHMRVCSSEADIIFSLRVPRWTYV
jgi:hypothetical protein